MSIGAEIGLLSPAPTIGGPPAPTGAPVGEQFRRSTPVPFDGQEFLRQAGIDAGKPPPFVHECGGTDEMVPG